jgi:drug/metabolite transporter (DMT)-like permease
MEWLAERPTLTRAIGAVQIVGGVLWALSESDD